VSRIPVAAAFLGAAGLIPFVYAMVMLFIDEGTLPTFGVVPSDPAGGVHILWTLGAILLGFMGGCLWGFASAPGREPTLVLLGTAAVPAVLAFLAIRPDPALSCLWLAFGFVVLQAIDVAMQRAGVTPGYWLQLRLPLTAGVVACLLAGALYG
jgi:hypothetical protein